MLISRFNLLGLQWLSNNYYLNKIFAEKSGRVECLHDIASKTRVQAREDFGAILICERSTIYNGYS